jgi:hypothetical protein
MEGLPMERLPSEKELAWQRELQRLEKVGDKLGYRVDPGIKDTVVAFILNGFPTYGSCEGHLEERRGKMIKLHPYIAVGLGEPDERFISEAEIRQGIADQFGIAPDEIHENDAAGSAYWKYIREHDIQETEEFKAVRAKNEILRKEFAEVFEEFYRQKGESDERLLSIRDLGPVGHFRIEDAKKNPIKEIPEGKLETLREELAREQAEMAAFAKFLRERYFAESSS